MTENASVPRESLAEALELSEGTLKNLEISNIPLSRIVLKAIRVARLINDSDYFEALKYESSGYPLSPNGLSPDLWKLAVLSNRIYEQIDLKSKAVKQFAACESIEALESQIESGRVALQVAADSPTNISSSNPNQYVWHHNNAFERSQRWISIQTASIRLAQRRAFIYDFVLSVHYQLKFSGVASDIFTRIRTRVDSSIGITIPKSVQKFTAIYENLQSENPEDWSNAVHGCRRILQDLADRVYPACDQLRITKGGKSIQLGPDNYVNRLICFVEDRSESNRFKDLVGSNLAYMGDRLDSILLAAQKGTHDQIASKEEADRYVLYTYMLVGDILTLLR